MKRKLILTTIFSIVLILILATSVFANFQSIPTGNSYSDITASEWIKGIRQMEALGNGMGLNETINESTLLSTSGSNNIDVHMIKNTEYGAIVLLGASEYGKQGSTIKDRYMNMGTNQIQTASGTDIKATTTGNVYGIYELGYENMRASGRSDGEIVAGGGSNSIGTAISPRYINRYTTSENSAKIGDATVETEDWHGGSSVWLSKNPNVYIRGELGAFNYDHYLDTTYSYSRATVVCGTGF